MMNDVGMGKIKRLKEFIKLYNKHLHIHNLYVREIQPGTVDSALHYSGEASLPLFTKVFSLSYDS